MRDAALNQEIEQMVSVSKPVDKPPDIPANLDTVDSGTLIELYQQLEGWHAHIGYLIACVRTRLLDVGVEKSERRADFSIQLREQLRSNREIRDSVTTDPRYQRLAAEERRLEAQRRGLAAMLERISRQVKMLSRVIELRRQDVELGHLSSKATRRAALSAATQRGRRKGS